MAALLVKSPVRAAASLLWQIPRRCITKISDPDFALDYLEGDQAGIAVCSMSRPKVMNALNRNARERFQEAMDMIKFDSSLRVMILRSMVPGVFSVGGDLKERITIPEAEVGPYIAAGIKTIGDLAELPIPTIAAMDGIALGGGMEIALSCDIRVASTNAKMGLTETKLAIIPGGGGTQKMARVIGPALAKELIFTGRAIGGSEAHRLGLVNHVVDQNDDGDAAYHKALAIALEISPNGPIALRMAKQAINRGTEVDMSSALAFEQACYAQVIPSQDRMEGLMAFREKRPPKYTGQ